MSDKENEIIEKLSSESEKEINAFEISLEKSLLMNKYLM